MSYKITFGTTILSINQFVEKIKSISETMCDNCGASCSSKKSASRIHIQADSREAAIKCDYYYPQDNSAD